MSALVDELRAIRVRYTNYRGETDTRNITPKRIWWGSTVWHSEPQWLLSAFDHDKDADRDFTLLDMAFIPALTTLQSRLEAVEAERDAWLRIVADISAAVPIPDILLATKSRKDLTAYFRAKVDRTEAAEARVEELQKALELWPRAVRDVFEIELKINRTDPMDALESALSAADSEVRALAPARTEEGKP